MSEQSKSFFGQRLKQARLRLGLAQDKLGVAVGLDEGSSSARISRYEGGIHEPPFSLVAKLAKALNVPTAYFLCDDDVLAAIMLNWVVLSAEKRQLVANYLLTIMEQPLPDRRQEHRRRKAK